MERSDCEIDEVGDVGRGREKAWDMKDVGGGGGGEGDCLYLLFSALSLVWTRVSISGGCSCARPQVESQSPVEEGELVFFA